MRYQLSKCSFYLLNSKLMFLISAFILPPPNSAWEDLPELTQPGPALASVTPPLLTGDPYSFLALKNVSFSKAHSFKYAFTRAEILKMRPVFKPEDKEKQTEEFRKICESAPNVNSMEEIQEMVCIYFSIIIFKLLIKVLKLVGWQI
jgi:hypothetical protein